jgi:hypothetical protein
MKADATLSVRAAAERDTANIVGGITDTNKHLKSACKQVPDLAVSGVNCEPQ